MRILLALILFAASQLALAAEPIGRIFFTVEQRAQLDQLRAQRIVASQVRDEPVPELITFNGIIRRNNDGKSSVWVNNQLLSESELQNKQSISGTVGRNGQIVLQSPQGDARMRLKVGQSAELQSGRVDESYAIRPPAKAPVTPPSKSAAPSGQTGPVPGSKSGTPAEPKESAEPETKTAPR